MSKLVAAWLLEDLVRKPRFNFEVYPLGASLNAPAELSANYRTKPVRARHQTGSRVHPLTTFCIAPDLSSWRLCCDSSFLDGWGRRAAHVLR